MISVFQSNHRTHICCRPSCYLLFYLCLQESERKAYNPRSFCKVYHMDKQPLNTGEQKDMTEFFTDLITKMEEMGPQLVGHQVRTSFAVMTYHMGFLSECNSTHVPVF